MIFSKKKYQQICASLKLNDIFLTKKITDEITSK